MSRDKLSSPYKNADCALNVHSLLLLLSNSKMDSKRGLSLCSHLDLHPASPDVDACSCTSRRFTVRSKSWICLPSSYSRSEPHRPLECLDRPGLLQQRRSIDGKSPYLPSRLSIKRTDLWSLSERCGMSISLSDLETDDHCSIFEQLQ